MPPFSTSQVAQMVKKNKNKKTLPANAGDAGSVPGLGRSPEEGNGNPFQYSCQDNPMDRGAWWATVWGCRESELTAGPLLYVSVLRLTQHFPYNEHRQCSSWYSYHQDTSSDFRKQTGLFLPTISGKGLPRWLSGKESACQCRKHGFDP